MIHLARTVLILIAPGFEEAMATLAAEIRSHNIAVSMVGLTSGAIVSQHGVAIQPDCSLEQVSEIFGRHALIIPGGSRCITTLLTDPRVFRLGQQVLAAQGTIFATASSQTLLYTRFKKKIKQSGQFVTQDNRPLPEYIQAVVACVAGLKSADFMGEPA